jgi:hypothetical protein
MNINPDFLYEKADDPRMDEWTFRYPNTIANLAYQAGYSGLKYPSTSHPNRSSAMVLFNGRFDYDKLVKSMMPPLLRQNKKLEIVQVSATDIGVAAYQIQGYEDQGMVYFVDQGSMFCGAQCESCWVIVWTDANKNAILNADTPKNVPDHGPGYIDYYFETNERYLSSLPPCPVCKQKQYRFLDSRCLPRLEKGLPCPDTSKRIIQIDSSHILVWQYVEGIKT